MFTAKLEAADGSQAAAVTSLLSVFLLETGANGYLTFMLNLRLLRS